MLFRSVQESKLVASDGFPEDRFGKSLALDGDTALITSNLGVYVFRYNGSEWVEETKLNPSLIDEGSSRELIHNIQNLRKDSGFNISDKIIMTYSSDEYLKNIINKFESHISQEILATNIIFEKSETGDNAFQINNSNIFISLKISN